MRLRSKITVAMLGSSLAISSVIAVVLYVFIERRLRADVEDRLHDVAYLGAHEIDIAAYRRLVAALAALDANPGSDAVAAIEHSADYRAVSDQLQVIRAADPQLIRFVYLLAPTDDPTTPRFIVDADVLAIEARHAAERISHFGQRYDASQLPRLVEAVRDCSASHEADFYYDAEFDVESVSAYLPLADASGTADRDAGGRCSGVLGVDITIRNVSTVLAAARTLEVGVALAGIVATLAAALLLGRLLTRSIHALAGAVRRYGDRDYAARAPPLPRDEIGDLGVQFDAMAAEIERHHDQLEDLVAKRTQALRAEEGARAQRDVQLAEVYAEVRAVRAAGDGRYTGQVLGRFALGRVIGRGAMGEVYEASDPEGRAVAVKVLATQLADDREAVERFHREARVIARLDTPHIVCVVEVSQPGAGAPFIAMERLVGTDLGELLKTKPVRDLDEVVEITRAVAAGLDAAHAAGIVHRDLKPSNVFAAVGDDDAITWKVLDFGVSKIRGEATLTRAHVVGTPSYMAPEQARGDAVDARADIYALGVMIYRLLTGRPVVTPRDAPAMMLDVVFRMPARPSDFIAITAEVEAVLAIALAKRPADRFANIRELADALADAASRPMPELVARGAVLLARTPWGSWAAEDTAPRIERKMDCPDNDDLTALLDGVLASDRQAAVEAHVAACAACRAVLGELVALAGTDDTAPA